MPALLGPTNPVPGYDPAPVKVTTPPLTDTSVQNIVDPNRVVRPDARTEQQDTGDATGSYAARYESNFMTFLQRLRGAQDLPTMFLRMLQGQEMQVTSGIESGFAAEMSEFLEFLQMDEGELLSFLQNQIQSGSRFGGALFDTLRSAYANTGSDLLRSDIAQFLRRFSDYSSTEHLEGKLLRTVSDMTDSLPSPWSAQVSELLAKLQNGVEAGDREGNLKLLRQQLFPLVSRYVSLTHDHGRARSLLSMMTLDVARYQNGDQKGLLQSLRHLASNGALPKELAQLSDDELMRMLRQTTFSKASQGNRFADRMAALTGRALQGEDGAQTQEVFHNILSSILINESVYMPLQHIMLPLEWNGQLMFSELWIDPDAERGSPDSGGESTARVLIKLDIQSLGAFDLLFNARKEGVSLLASCPAPVAEHGAEVSKALTSILSRNGLSVEQVSVAEMKRPVTVSEVFPKLFERMSGVNVKA